jgi:hypothetical protein
VRVGKFFATFVILDLALLTVYLILYFTVFAEPTYVPFASGSVSTLVPQGPHSSYREGMWQVDHFGGKGNLVIRTRHLPRIGLSDLIRRAKAEGDRRRVAAADTVAGAAGGGESEPGAGDLSELVRRTIAGDSTAGDTLSTEAERGQVITAGRTLIQLLASNTPNLRFTEEIPAFDSTIFCLGAVGRGQRWYRYLIQSGDMVVDLSMHSPHSSHIVYKEVLDKAFLNLRIDGVTSNHIVAQAVEEINGRVSPRWAQGNIFWLIFFVALPNGIMLILLLVFRLAGGSPAGRIGGIGPDLGTPAP